MFFMKNTLPEYSPAKLKKESKQEKKTWEFFKNVDLSQEIFQGKNFKVTDGQQNYNRSA